jgi:hypothetical protein
MLTLNEEVLQILNYLNQVTENELTREEYEEYEDRLIRILDNGFDINAKLDTSNSPPIFYIVSLIGNVKLLNYILEKKQFNPNVKNTSGDTLLHYLIRQESKWLSEALLIQRLLRLPSINLTVKDSTGKTALQFAASRKCVRSLAVMFRYGKITANEFYDLVSMAITECDLEFAWQLFRIQKENGCQYLNNTDLLCQFSEVVANRGYLSILKCIEHANPEAIHQHGLARKLLSHPQREQIEMIVSYMNFREGESVKLSDISIKILFTAKNTKAFLGDMSKFEVFMRDFVNLIATTPILTCRVFFIITTNHWTVGEIQIKAGMVNLFVFDPLGFYGASSGLESYLNDIIICFKTKIPYAKIYSSLEKLQHHDYQSCVMFAADCILHLSNAGNYLPPGYEGKDIFDYFEDHTIGYSYSKGEEKGICLTSMPIRLLRSMQSIDSKSNTYGSALFSKSGINAIIGVAAEAERNAPINKKGETTTQSLQQHFVLRDGKEVNDRIQYKINRARFHVLSYLLDHDKFDLDAISQSFGREAMIEYINTSLQPSYGSQSMLTKHQ